MSDILRQGAAADLAKRRGRRTSALSSALSDLQWRQRYANADVYPLELASGVSLGLCQKMQGELTGLGTGATVLSLIHI